MKYIRTKDGRVIGFNTYRDDVDLIAYLSQFANYQGEFAAIKQADTIEELCDAFVMFCPNAIRRNIRVYEDMRSISLYSKRDKRWNGNMVDKIYGAIWTDKGLIYVAKMNNKGELELL